MGTEYYAYQIALKTMKERCDYLQNKLDSLEEENSQLKLQVSQDINKSSTGGFDGDQLRLQVALLVEQKAKLNHQVQLVTSENQKLWSRLSRLTSNNENVGSSVNIKEEPLHCEGNVSYSENHSDLEISKVAISPDANKESLEEISLKLNALIMEKRGISADSSSAIDLYTYKNSFQMENFAFSSSDNVPLLNSFKNHITKLKQFKQILQNNKNDLTSAITLLKNFQKNNMCSDCGKIFTINCNTNSSSVNKMCDIVDQMNDMSTLQVHEVGVEASVDEIKVDKVCPLCGTLFSGSFQELCDHVNQHFPDDDIDVTNTFEMVP